ncbi:MULTISPECIES: DUF3102 domain-containing protein [unclassified Dehalobacter]|nr:MULTISPECIES: DUF3102 domain-containing protein [unclassified Dehalobacter]
MLQNCVQIKACLTEAKAAIPYGKWGKWLARFESGFES